MYRASAVVTVGAILLASGQAYAQAVKGRVVDEQTRRPVRQAIMLLTTVKGDTIDKAMSNDSGFFSVAAKISGEFQLTAGRAGYVAETRTIRITDTADLTVPAFVLRSEAIPLDSLAVQTARRADPDPAPVGFSRSTHVVAGERMAAFEASGVSMLNVLRQLPNVRVIEYMLPSGTLVVCVESTRRMGSLQPRADRCGEQMPFVVDGVMLDIESVRPILRSGNIQDYESVEYLTPVEAGYRYGLGASSGVIVLWSRGRGPHASEARNRR
jgi:hypothetical protein